MKNFILTITILIFCGAPQAQVNNNEYKIIDNIITVLIDTNEYYTKTNLPFKVKVIKEIKYWDSKSIERLSEDGILRIVFNKPIYVQSVYLQSCDQVKSKMPHALQRLKRITVEKTILENQSFPLENSFTLQDSSEIQTISLEKRWTKTINLFKTKELILKADEIFPSNRDSLFYLSKLDIIVDDKMNYKTSMTWEKLYEFIKQNRTIDGKTWTIRNFMNPRFDYFSDLMYFVIEGNVEARSIFESYKPTEVSDNESLLLLFRPAISEMIKLNDSLKR